MNQNMILWIFSSVPATILLFFIGFSLRGLIQRKGGIAALKKLPKPTLTLSALCFIGSFLTIPFTIGGLMLFLWISSTAPWEIWNILFLIGMPVVAILIIYVLCRAGVYLLEHPQAIAGKLLIGVGIIVIGLIAISIVAAVIGPLVFPDRHTNFLRHFSRGEYKLAVGELEKFEYASYDNLSASYIKLGKFGKALAVCDEQIRKVKGYNNSYDLYQAYRTRAAVYYWQGDFDSAINDYKAIIRLCENNTNFTDKIATRAEYESSISIANCRAKLGDYEDALHLYDSAEKLARETDLRKKGRYRGGSKPDVAAILAKGDFYLWRKNPGKALEDYNRAINLSDGEEDAFERRANLFASEGNYKSALEDINAAIVECCGDGWKYTYAYNKYCRERAFLYNKLGMVRKAEKDSRHYAGFLRDRKQSSKTITFNKVEQLTHIPGLIVPFDHIT